MITVVIPTYNEALHLNKTILSLQQNDAEQLIAEIIVSDGGSTDGTAKIAGAVAGVRFVKSNKKGRAAQMNYGASLATAGIIYFIHADTTTQKYFTTDIKHALANGYNAGCFTLQFDYAHWFLKANAWFTRFNINAIRFGDQSLFVTAALFAAVGGFSENHIVMEDQEIVKRLKKQERFTVIKKPVTTSARKYLLNGIYKTQGIFFLIYFMYQMGYSQQRLVATYKKWIRQDKL